jgi:hypothetical protein
VWINPAHCLGVDFSDKLPALIIIGQGFKKKELCCNIDNVPRGTFCLYESIRQVWINPAESISSRGLCVSIIIGQGFKKKESYVSGVSKSSPQLEQM